MKKSNLVREIVRQRGVGSAKAADEVDRAVTKILRALKSGREARLPGIGTISPGKPWVFRPESRGPESHGN
jgi:nucleoid DNA-binding protein